MNLRLQANADLEFILGDTVGGFGWAISVTSPAGVSAELTGLSTDIGHMIDPTTGALVAGRRASVTLSIAKLRDAGLGIPVGVSDESLDPWIVQFEDISGIPRTFKVASSMPDQAIGQVTCMVEAYIP